MKSLDKRTLAAASRLNRIWDLRSRRQEFEITKQCSAIVMHDGAQLSLDKRAVDAETERRREHDRVAGTQSSSVELMRKELAHVRALAGDVRKALAKCEEHQSKRPALELALLEARRSLARTRSRQQVFQRVAGRVMSSDETES